MIKYKLKENAINIDSIHPMEDYLHSLGINKPQDFILLPPKEDELDPFLLINMDKCVRELHEGFTNNKSFFLQIDSDVDGMTSATIFYRFFKGYYPSSKIT